MRRTRRLLRRAKRLEAGLRGVAVEALVVAALVAAGLLVALVVDAVAACC